MVAPKVVEVPDGITTASPACGVVALQSLQFAPTFQAFTPVSSLDENVQVKAFASGECMAKPASATSRALVMRTPL